MKLYSAELRSIKLHLNIKMYTIFINSKNSKKRSKKYRFIKSKHLLHMENIKSLCNSNKFKISAPTWNDKFELLDGSYSVSNIQDYFEHILKTHKENIDNPSVNIYVNKTENRITFKIENGYSLEFLTPETMKLLGSTENKITKDKNSENVPHLEITEVVLVQCNIVNNDYQQDSRVLYTFVPNKLFGSLLEISPTNHVFLQTFNSEFQTI